MNQAKGKPLTLELVFNKTKSDNLNNIKNLNLWGNELEDLSLIDRMPNLEVISLSVNNIKNLNLWGNELEDLSLIDRMPNLEVISLSVNKINSLKDFASCSKLHVEPTINLGTVPAQELYFGFELDQISCIVTLPQVSLAVRQPMCSARELQRNSHPSSPKSDKAG